MYTQLLIILGILGIIAECYFISLWILAYRTKKKEIIHPYSPSACVIIPCKGVLEGFTENINAFCLQKYPSYKLIFVVDSEKDSAYNILAPISKKYTNVSIKITKYKGLCSGKIAALLTGIESIKTAEVLVFADSDIKPNNTWLKNLVEPLYNPSIGASTGYRWYFPTNLKTQLISAWNMASIALMFNPRYNFTWGGSTAIRLSIFNQLDIITKWKTAFSDDLVFTTALKNAGYKIYFQPKCITESPPDASIKKFLGWGTRQYTWIRWYFFNVWLSSIIGLVGLKILTILGIILLINGQYIPGLLMTSTILFEMLYGWQGINIMQKTMTYPKQRFSSKINYALMSPIVFFMIAYNMLASSIKKQITWAGRVYKKPNIND
jgi:cellulose synthase/poly-beta-1,6-N-acetylglucosamine synthase-like glycosyltransferase